MAARSYLGALIVKRQFDLFGDVIERKSVHFVAKLNDQSRRERLWFSLGRFNAISLIVFKAGETCDELVSSGLFIDLREMEFSTATSFYEYLVAKIYGASERVRLCNLIRDRLASHRGAAWCGSERESIFNEGIFLNSSEISGLCDPYLGVTTAGDNVGTLPSVGSNHWTFRLFEKSLLLPDLGQSKLCSLMMGAYRANTDYIYVGSAPGNGWIRALEELSFQGRVYSFDPRPLECVTSIDVVHVQRAVLAWEDIRSELEFERGKNLFFIWDVRSDGEHPREPGMDTEAYGNRLREEIKILSSILMNADFREMVHWMQIKVSLRMLNYYPLPPTGRFVPQPFSLERDIWEVRFVSEVDPNMELVHPAQATRDNVETMLKTLCEMPLYERNLRLFMNTLCSGFVRRNYLETSSRRKVTCEIYLYTINMNPPDRVSMLVRRMLDVKRPFIISYFTPLSMRSGEYLYPEMDILDSTLLHICDSRSIIRAKLEGLYFMFSGLDLRFFSDELKTSETYSIKETESQLVRLGLIDQYDRTRVDHCRVSGVVFPRIPTPFSVGDGILSPSGHMLRLCIEHVVGRVSLGMYILRLLHHARDIKKDFVSATVRSDSPNGFEKILRPIIRGSGLERSPKMIWHSVDEWMAGIVCAAAFVKNHRDPLSTTGDTRAALYFGPYALDGINSLETAKAVLNRHLVYKRVGEEVFNFYSRFGFVERASLIKKSAIYSRPLSANHKCPSDVRTVEEVLFYVHRRSDSDLTNYFLSSNIKDDLWVCACVDMRLDAIVRSHIVHESYKLVLSMGKSYRSPITMVDLLIRRAEMMGNNNARIWRYFRDRNHPAHNTVLSVSPNLERAVLSAAKWGEALRVLAEANARFAVIPITEWLTVTSLHESILDMITHHWIARMPHKRSVLAEELDILGLVTSRYPHLLVSECIRVFEDVLPRGRVILRSDVLTEVKKLFPYAYP